MRFSAATTAERLLPERLALRLRPLVDRIDAIISDPGERGAAGRMSIIAFAIRVVSAAIAFVSQVLLARWMGSFEYGIFVLVWTTMTIAGSISGFGFPHDGHPLHPGIPRKEHDGRAARRTPGQPPVRAHRLHVDHACRHAGAVAAVGPCRALLRPAFHARHVLLADGRPCQTCFKAWRVPIPGQSRPLRRPI